MKLIKWIGDEKIKGKHQHDYRWIEDEDDRMEWIKKNWEIEDEFYND